MIWPCKLTRDWGYEAETHQAETCPNPTTLPLLFNKVESRITQSHHDLPMIGNNPSPAKPFGGSPATTSWPTDQPCQPNPNPPYIPISKEREQ